MPVRGQICQIWQAQLRGAEVTALAAEEKLLRASLADVQAEVPGWLAGWPPAAGCPLPKSTKVFFVFWTLTAFLF